MSRRRTALAVVPKSGEVVPLQRVRPARALTPKQEAFCRVYVETGNQAEAYRKAYDTSDMLPDTIYKRACELLADGKITGRVAEIEAECLALTQLTIARLASEGFKILESARAKGDDRAAIAALATLEKMHARLAPELPANPKGRNVAEMTDDWLAQCVAQGEASIDRPPVESRDEWMLRQAREKKAKVPDAHLLAMAAGNRDPTEWLLEQARLATPTGRAENEARARELLTKLAAAGDDAGVAMALPIIQQLAAQRGLTVQD